MHPDARCAAVGGTFVYGSRTCLTPSRVFPHVNSGNEDKGHLRGMQQTLTVTSPAAKDVLLARLELT